MNTYEKKRRSTSHVKALQAANTQRYHMTPNGRAKMLWHAAKRRAQDKQLPFDLSFEWVLERVKTGCCEVTALPFNLEERRTGSMNAPYAPSIDRRDSTRGYTPDNCRMVVWALNMALGQWGDEVFAVVAKAFAESEWLR